MKPVNKHILIEMLPEEAEEKGIIMPEGYDNKPKFSLVKVLAISDNNTLFEFQREALGTCLVVLTNMIESFVVKKEEYLIVPQSAVMAIDKDY